MLLLNPRRTLAISMMCMQLSHTQTVKLGTKRVAVALVNNSGEKVTPKNGTWIGQLKTANVVPPSLAPGMSTDVNVLEYV